MFYVLDGKFWSPFEDVAYILFGEHSTPYVLSELCTPIVWPAVFFRLSRSEECQSTESLSAELSTKERIIVKSTECVPHFILHLKKCRIIMYHMQLIFCSFMMSLHSLLFLQNPRIVKKCGICAKFQNIFCADGTCCETP
jgi:hypothetical protein